MHFCTDCNNMYYIRINPEDTNNLVYYCRNCGKEDDNLAVDNVCVLKTQIKQGEQSFGHIINKYTKLDPTLPRVNNVLCPNAECATNKDGKDKVEREIIYIRYDDTNMKYVYICAECDRVWKTNDK